MRRFEIWADVRDEECVIEMPDDASDDECEEACKDALNTLIGNGDSGWNELPPQQTDEGGEP